MPGHDGLTAGPRGVHDQAAVRTLMRRYDSQQPAGLILRGREVMWAGATLAAASFMLFLAARSGQSLLSGLAGIAAAVFGYRIDETAEKWRDTVKANKSSLARRIQDATRTTASKYEKARAGRGERRGSTSRFLTVFYSSS